MFTCSHIKIRILIHEYDCRINKHWFRGNANCYCCYREAAIHHWICLKDFVVINYCEYYHCVEHHSLNIMEIWSNESHICSSAQNHNAKLLQFYVIAFITIILCNVNKTASLMSISIVQWILRQNGKPPANQNQITPKGTDSVSASISIFIESLITISSVCVLHRICNQQCRCFCYYSPPWISYRPNGNIHWWVISQH